MSNGRTQVENATSFEGDPTFESKDELARNIVRGFGQLRQGKAGPVDRVQTAVGGSEMAVCGAEERTELVDEKRRKATFLREGKGVYEL